MSGADVVGLNEVLHPVTAGNRTYAPLAELANRLGMSTYFVRRAGLTKARPGTGRLAMRCQPISADRRCQYAAAPAAEHQTAVSVGATLASGPVQGLTAFVTHLDDAFEGTRLFQMDGVLQRTHATCRISWWAISTPLGSWAKCAVRLGTFPRCCGCCSAAGYADAFHAVGEGHGRTFPSQSPLGRIDFLFMPNLWARGLAGWPRR